MKPNYAAITAELRASSRWVLWRLEDVKDRQRCKVPRCASNLTRGASSTDASTWSSFDTCLEKLELLSPLTKYEHEECAVGLGLVIDVPFIGVDLDACLTDAGPNALAKDFLAKFPPTYTELSPSRKGLHLWYKGVSKKDGLRTKTAEVYAKGRYLTVTGWRLDGTPDEVTQLDANQVQQLFAWVENQRVQEKHDQVKGKHLNSEKFDALMRGDLAGAGFNDVSAAVQSLLTQLARKHLLDRAAIEAEFVTSGLYKDHSPHGGNWIEKWGRLKESELDKAIAQARQWVERDLQKKPQREQQNYTYEPIVGCFSDVKEEVLEWLWDKKIPRNDAVIFAGDPGIGKSLLALDLAARGSAGEDFADGTTNVWPPFRTLFLSLEDSRESIMSPRLRAAGADLKLIHFLDMVRVRDEHGEIIDARVIDLESDVARLREAIRSLPNLQLVVIDPISNYMGGMNMYRDQDLRKIVVPLMSLAREEHVSIIIVMHNSKQTGRSGLAKIGASLGGVGALRIAWSFVEDGEHCLMLQSKKNLGKFAGIKYTTVGVPLEIDGRATEQARLKFLEHSGASIENVLSAKEDPEEARAKPAHDLIKKMIPENTRDEVNAGDLFAAAKLKGISESSLKRARGDLGLATTKKKDGWYWRWPDAPRTVTHDEQTDSIF